MLIAVNLLLFGGVFTKATNSFAVTSTCIVRVQLERKDGNFGWSVGFMIVMTKTINELFVKPIILRNGLLLQTSWHSIGDGNSNSRSTNNNHNVCAINESAMLMSIRTNILFT